MAELAVGDEFAGCRVEHVIGAGGMGVVYRGMDLRLERPVAIKLIAADRSGDASARRRFEREARLMAGMDHPNVIPVYAAGEQDGNLYLVMRYVDGTDLQKRIHREGALGPGETARVIDQVAKALDAAHDRGLVHRDVKPANVLLSGDHIYLTDFGITRLVDESTRTTETGDWVGTIDFMAPEHLRGEETDARSDVYSLGCVLYACLTGVAPFKRTTMAATIAAHLNDRPPLPSHTHPGISPVFDQIVGRALAKAPSHRYSSAGELAAAVGEAAAGKPLRWGRGNKRTNHGPPESPTRLKDEQQDETRVLEVGEMATEVAAGENLALRAAAKRAARRARAQETPSPTASASPGRDQAALSAPEKTSRREKTRVQGADSIPTLRLSEHPDAQHRRRGPVVVATAALLVAVAAVVVVLALHTSKPKPLKPFSTAQVSDTVNAFADAYTSRSISALSALLAPAVTRMDPTGVEHGAAKVLADYRGQFKTTPLPVSYTLSGMVISAGWVGRASGRYTVKLTGGGSLHGHVTFAVQRIGDKALIGLIVTQQDSSTAAPVKSKSGATRGSVGTSTAANPAGTAAPTASTPTSTAAAPQPSSTPAAPVTGGPAGLTPGPGRGHGRGYGHGHHHGTGLGG